MKFSTLSLAIITTLSLSACVLQSEDNGDNRLCDANLGEVKTSDGRTLCLSLGATRAQAPFMAGFKAPGRVEHTITITDAVSGAALDITSDSRIQGVMHYPMMSMVSGHAHSTPIKMMADTTDATSGQYHTVAYYLMPSVMNGTVQGEWEYRVMLKDVGADGVPDTSDDSMLSTSFHPLVEMVMGGNKFSEKTERRTAGVYEDKVTNMDMTSATYRMYGIWLESVSNNNDGSHAVKLYLNAKDMAAGMHNHSMDTDMYTYPALKAGLIMTDENAATVTIDAVTVEATAVATPAPSDWITLSATMMDGYYAGNISGLATDAQNTLQVRVTVTSTAAGVTSTEVMSVRGSDDTMPTLVFTAP